MAFSKDYYELLRTYKFEINGFGDVIKRMDQANNGGEVLAYVFLLIGTRDASMTIQDILEPRLRYGAETEEVRRSVKYFKRRLFNQGFIDGSMAVESEPSVPIFNDYHLEWTEDIKNNPYSIMREQVKHEILRQLQISYINGYVTACETGKAFADLSGKNSILENESLYESLRPVENEKSAFCIKPGYQCNTDTTIQLSATNTIEASEIYQYAVYEKARDIILENRFKSVIDLGCGMGIKLEELIRPVCSDITGVDNYETIDKCKRLHSFGNWYACNLSAPELNIDRKYDLIIASDVIEHLSDPDQFMSLIERITDTDSIVILSTPERDLRCGSQHYGPSENITHIREWNFYEFKEYIKGRGFDLIEHYLTPAIKDSGDNRGLGSTQLMVLRKQPDRTSGPLITFFMLVIDRDVLIADYAVRSFSMIKDFKFKLRIYSNWMTPEHKQKYFERWRKYDYVEIVANDWQDLNNLPPEDTFFGRQGSYERCDPIWDRELRKINTPYCATVDADFEILNPEFVTVMLQSMEDDPGIGVMSVNKCKTGPYYDTILNERMNTWFCVYRKGTLRCSVSHLYYEEWISDKEPKNTWDSSGFYQKALREIDGWDLATIDGRYGVCFIHYGAFSKNRHLDETNIEIYRLLRILKQVGHNGLIDQNSERQYRELLKSKCNGFDLKYSDTQSLPELADILYKKLFIEVDKSNPYKRATMSV